MWSTSGQDDPVEGGVPGCVLVVEDDDLLRRAVVRLIRKWGYASLEAPDGRSALDQVRESWDLLNVVLLDMMLPVYDGVEVARRVKAERPGLPIVACSAAFSDEVKESLRGLGVDGILPKPFSAGDLQSTLERLMASP